MITITFRVSKKTEDIILVDLKQKKPTYGEIAQLIITLRKYAERIEKSNFDLFDYDNDDYTPPSVELSKEHLRGVQ